MIILLAHLEFFVVGAGKGFLKDAKSIKEFATLPTFSHSLVADYDDIIAAIPTFFMKLNYRKSIKLNHIRFMVGPKLTPRSFESKILNQG